MTCKSIGTVRCPVTQMSAGNWAKVESRIELDPALAPGLRGLEEFSHVLVVFYLDRIAAFDAAKQLLRQPRGMEDLKPVGVFAQRTKFRPNPIGVTAVQLVSVAGNVLTVRGLDALDGTPVLDVKPYIAAFDRMDATMPAWVEHMMEGYF
ncbi:MAG: tRNA (N6-threonylcarbamoyladenosine(37)-N6)-methyltransferase TrmO [Betaproteobacteria bacterium]|nr:tRNA (N6-threonylcarbamoyladenosine(37)-N6)-methyltransferase TrmO [Betaproteobacteria bacterium]